MKCFDCPVKCGADRSVGCGACKTGENFVVSHSGLHFWEEPVISGKNGSGTIFFGGCNLNCVFCQNSKISRDGSGTILSSSQLLELMLGLKATGAHNINLVTPSHFARRLKPVLVEAKKTLDLPIVYNSGGYDDLAVLKELEGLIDVYLPDFKYADDELAKKYGARGDYFEIASAALKEMLRQQPKVKFGADGMIEKGVVVRHLVLPNNRENTQSVLDYLSGIDKNLYVSLMAQYFPAGNALQFEELSRPLKQREYDNAVEYFFNVGLKNGFMQTIASAKEEYVPVFNMLSNTNGG